jgi:hypothetical protein
MKPTHGSEHIEAGNLRGATDRTDYFYFFCPRCADNRILRILDFKMLREEAGSKYNEKCRSKAHRTFIFGLELFCEECGLHDYVKLSNCGWQGGKHAETLA